MQPASGNLSVALSRRIAQAITAKWNRRIAIGPAYPNGELRTRCRPGSSNSEVPFRGTLARFRGLIPSILPKTRSMSALGCMHHLNFDRLISMRFMRQAGFIAISFISVGVAVLLTSGIASLRAQGPGGGQAAQALFAALDADNDGTLTRPELESGFQSWFTAWDTTHSGTLTQPQILAGITTLLPPPPPVKPGQANTFNPAGNLIPHTAPVALYSFQPEPER